MNLFCTVLGVLACIVAIPIAVVCLEICAALLLRKKPVRNVGCAPAPRVAILIPAHNESDVLLPTLHDVKAQMRSGDRLLVVADNCTDNTAEVACLAGAEVLARVDPGRRGKGYALDWGVRYLSRDPPDVVLIIDADCRVSEGAIMTLASTSYRTRRPTQALDLMVSPGQSNFAEFAWRIKNWVRPLGLSALGFPCQLMGTGMAFPWPLIRSADLASGEIVEDLKLGLELAAAGTPALFCPEALVTSVFPSAEAASIVQHRRWEHGHIRLLTSAAPRLLYASFIKRDLALAALALDLLVPPQSLLGAMLAITLSISAVSALAGSCSTALFIGAVTTIAWCAALLGAWFVYGREILPLRRCGSLIPHLTKKFYVYALGSRRQTGWHRTERELRKAREEGQ